MSKPIIKKVGEEVDYERLAREMVKQSGAAGPVAGDQINAQLTFLAMMYVMRGDDAKALACLRKMAEATLAAMEKQIGGI